MAINDIGMLLLVGGHKRTKKEEAKLLDLSGYEYRQAIEVLGWRDLIEAVEQDRNGEAQVSGRHTITNGDGK